jgi:hypothetical protein
MEQNRIRDEHPGSYYPVQFFDFKILKFFDEDPEFFDARSRMEKFGSLLFLDDQNATIKFFSFSAAMKRRFTAENEEISDVHI